MAAAKKPKKSSVPNKKTVVVDGEELSLEESLDRARIALETSQNRLLDLHRSWRAQLQRLSLLALFLILKQASIPAYDCLDQIQEWNDQATMGGETKTILGDWEKVTLILGDSMTEIFSVLCCISLLWLLYQPLQGNDFSTLPFKLSLATVPMILASYSNDPMVGCLAEDLEGFEEKPRTFPVTLILLLVCLASLFMMQNQQKQETENLQKVQKLRDDLLGSKKAK